MKSKSVFYTYFLVTEKAQKINTDYESILNEGSKRQNDLKKEENNQIRGGLYSKLNLQNQPTTSDAVVSIGTLKND